MKTLGKASLVILVFCAIISSFYSGYYVGHRGFVIELKANPPEIKVQNKEPKTQTVDFKYFWAVWDSVNKNHIDRPLDSQKLLYGAISGMVSAIGDDYTSYFDPTQNEMAKSTLNGSYEGIGAELGFKDGQLIVISPLDGSPASEAGVKPGDKILEIEGISTLGIKLSEAVGKIRGKAGTSVVLKLQRGDLEAFNMKITRDKIKTKSVTWKDLGDGVGYLKLARFGDATISDWNESVENMTTQMPNLKSVVLDVRGNPGGYLNAAIYISGEFLKEGDVVLYEETAGGEQKAERVARKGTLLTVPVVVLIDGGSASASEIVTGALLDNERAVTVGTKSFGKGTVQASDDFDDGSSLHVTIAKWLTPKKFWVHKIGFDPKYLIERKENEASQEKDSQLDKAKEVAKNGGK